MTAGPARVASLVIPILLLTAPSASAGGEEPIVCTLKNQEFCGEWNEGTLRRPLLGYFDGARWTFSSGGGAECEILEEFRRDGWPFSVLRCIYVMLDGARLPPTITVLALKPDSEGGVLMETEVHDLACVPLIVDTVLNPELPWPVGCISRRANHERLPR